MANVMDEDITFEKEIYLVTKTSSTESAKPEQTSDSGSWSSTSTQKDEREGPTVFFKGLKSEVCLTPFYLRWSFGRSLNVPVINLTGKERTLIAYGATHAAILYDYVAKDMRLLQGHKNLISSISVDDSGKWLVTADKGNDNTIIVWDTFDYIPVNTIFNPHPDCGTAVVGISGNAKYLVTVGCETSPQIKFWLWTYGKDEPDDTVISHYSHGLPLKVSFNPNVQEHIMITFEKGILFLHWDVQNEKIMFPTFPVIKNVKKIGSITDSTYIDACHECVATTTEGSVLIFGNTLYTRRMNEADLENTKMFIKAIKISVVTINCIGSVDGVVVTGDVVGNIKFYDKGLKILYWCQKFTLPSITAICFNLEPRRYKLKDAFDMEEDIFKEHEFNEKYTYDDRSDEYEHLYKQLVPSDATIEQLPFIVRDFIVSTNDGRLASIDYIHNKQTYLFRKSYAPVTAIDLHDEMPYLCIAYANNTVCLYNYQTHEIVSEKTLPEEHDDFLEEIPQISYIKYSPNSYFLACGKENGVVCFLEPIILTPKFKQPKRISKWKIVKLVYSSDSRYLAYYDVDALVGLLKYSAEEETFLIVGKIRSHYKEIYDILFTPDLPMRLFTIGADRYIVEYDIEGSVFPSVRLLSRERTEQIAIPLTFMYYPTKKECTEKYFFVSDNQCKYKIINDISFMCHSVVLGPAYGCYKDDPVKNIQLLPNHQNRYMVYSNKINVGIQILPADGNPYKFVGTIGHPVELLNFRLDHKGKYIFTIGADDNCVLMWQVNVLASEHMVKLGGKNLEPYYCLIEGGLNGWLFKEMEDLFYYMQILHQGENTLLPRIVNDKISITELPDLMRACGFYPSDYEIENMLVDIRYRNYDETDTLKEEISFYEFVQLYINYRPAHGVSIETLEDSFKTLCLGGRGASGCITRKSFAAMICERGEYFSISKARNCLAVLMNAEDADEQNMDLNFAFLPEEIDFKIFLEDILGIDLERQTIEETENQENAAEETEHGC